MSIITFSSAWYKRRAEEVRHNGKTVSQHRHFTEIAACKKEIELLQAGKSTTAEPRVGKPGEVWQSNYGPDHIAVITHGGHLWIGPRFNMEHINRVGTHAFREAEDDVFLAPTLEAYYQQMIEA